jgi:hypothetical protein
MLIWIIRLMILKKKCCCGSPALVDRWRPCGQTISGEDIFLRTSVRMGMPTPDSVVQINDHWRCYFLVEEDIVHIETFYDSITYQDDCEDFDCACLEDIACLQIAGFVPGVNGFFGAVKVFVLGGCNTAGVAHSVEVPFNGQLTQTADCTWSGGDFFIVNYGGIDQVWAFTIGITRQTGRYRMAVQFNRIGGGPVSGQAVLELISSFPNGTYTFVPGESGPELNTPGCYVFTPQTITIELC